MPAFERECRFNIKADDFRAYGEQVLSKLQAFVEGNADYTVADDEKRTLHAPYFCIASSRFKKESRLFL